MSAGLYKIDVAKEGFKPESRTVTIVKGKDKDVSFNLTQETGKLQISVNPTEAVSILKKNGVLYRTWDGSNSLGNVPVGNYILSTTLFGYLSVSKQIVVRVDKSTTEIFFFKRVTTLRTLSHILYPEEKRLAV